MVYRRFGVQLLVGLCRTNYLIDLGGIQLRIPIFVPDGERKLMNNFLENENDQATKRQTLKQRYRHNLQFALHSR